MHALVRIELLYPHSTIIIVLVNHERCSRDYVDFSSDIHQRLTVISCCAKDHNNP